MIEPFQKDDALVADIRQSGQEPDALHLWWLGQSGFLLRWNGHGLIFDPYLSDSVTRKYAGSDTPRVRMTGRVIDAHRLEGIEAITSSHNHTDHLDAETLLSLTAANPQVRLVLPRANVEFARKRLGPEGPGFLPVDSGESVAGGPFVFYGISAAHNEVERDEDGFSRFLGFVVRFGDFSVYHSGDTLWHDSLVAEVRRFSIDLAILPINGARPERQVPGNLNGTEAAALAKAIGAKIVIPCHYGMFEFDTEEPEEFAACCERLGQPFCVLENGEGLTLEHR